MSEDIEVLKHKAVHKRELCFEGLYIDKCKRLVVRNENEIELTYTEFEILLLLAQNAGIRVFTFIQAKMLKIFSLLIHLKIIKIFYIA